MKVHLMYRDRDFDAQPELPREAQALRDDLDLDTLLAAMAQGDRFLLGVAEAGLFTSMRELHEIRYRQAVIGDCLAHPEIVRELYEIAVAAAEAQRKRGVFFGLSSRSASSILIGAVSLLELLLETLKRLRAVCDEHAGEFESDGFRAFFAMIAAELDDAYLEQLEDHLGELRLRHGARMGVRLGPGGNGTDYALRRRYRSGGGLGARVSEAIGLSRHVYRIADRDESGARTLDELRSRGVDLVANAAAQAAEHVRDFFGLLRAELGFCVGAINLHEQLLSRGQPICFPEPRPIEPAVLSARGLYEPCLALRRDGGVAGNDVDADGRPLVLVTGANQGGKSTFLRSVGIAQLMTQCGIFAAAEQLAVGVCTGLFTHFKREEDASMKSGKLDEELARMSEIADRARPGCVVLFNESFAATDEREGAELAADVVAALIDAGCRVCFVTHMYELAHPLYERERTRALFLRAQREHDGARDYRLHEAEPLATSYGRDVFERVFAEGAARFPPQAAEAR